jgi:NAD(P)-dependent dehydrogenase (short-subunit alcohol dehydrogenase family)
MTKAAQRALCAGAHLECAQRGIQFTAISPALVDTPGAAWSAADGKPAAEDVAQAVRFLLSTSTNCYAPELQLRAAGPFRAVLIRKNSCLSMQCQEFRGVPRLWV